MEFREALNTYLSELQSSPVRTLTELIRWNLEHHDLEMPPGKGGQSILEESDKTHSTKEECEELRAFMKQKADTEGLGLIFKKHGIDALLGPADSGLYDYATAARYPIASLPLGGLVDRGRPFGLVAIGRPGGERALVQVMSAWEKTFSPRVVPKMDELPV